MDLYSIRNPYPDDYSDMDLHPYKYIYIDADRHIGSGFYRDAHPPGGWDQQCANAFGAA